MSNTLPIARPQPNKPFYGLEELHLFKRYNRADAEAEFGDVPAWDKNRPIKRWADESAAALPPDEPYVFSFFEVAGSTVKRRSVALTNKEASSFNLPGVKVYAKRVLAPSGAYTAVITDGGTIARTPVPVEILSTREEALALSLELKAKEFQVGEINENTLVGGPYLIQYAPEENRRVLNIEIAGSIHNVGKLLASRYAAGLNAPGEWSRNADGSPRWISDISPDTGEQDLRPEVPIPDRPIYDNEKFIFSPFGVQVARTDTAGSQSNDNAKAEADNTAEILKRVIQIQLKLDTKLG